MPSGLKGLFDTPVLINFIQDLLSVLFCVFFFRLGGSTEDYNDVKNHAFFSSINFDDLMAKKVHAVMIVLCCEGELEDSFHQENWP